MDALAQAMIDASPAGIVLVGRDGVILRANAAMEEISGHPPAWLVGRQMSVLLPPRLRACHEARIQAFFDGPVRLASMGRGRLLWLERRDGTAMPVDVGLGHVLVHGQRCAVAVISDSSEQQRLRRELEFEARHDGLTGLANRRSFTAQLERACHLPAGQAPGLAALAVLGLDGFKLVNDSFGHTQGDAVLREVAHRLQAALRPGDTIARLGGDEFGLLLADLGEPEEAVREAARLLAVLRPGLRLEGGQEVFLGGSAGIALFPAQAANAEQLLRFAGMALCQAKAAGRGLAMLYDVAAVPALESRLRLHARLRHALAGAAEASAEDASGPRLHFQPIVDTASGRWTGYEALLRWRDPEHGDLPPAELVQVAEMTGLILPLGQWVLEQACRQLRAWLDAGIALPVAINVAMQQLHSADFPEQVDRALLRHGVPARLLGLEITESQVMADPAHVRRQLVRLAALGVSLSLDDFGTGHASLAHLRQLPVHRLKVSREFIADLPHDQVLAAMVSYMAALARALGLTVVAEGVETEAQRGLLQQLGVLHCQGWLFAPALPAQEAARRRAASAP